MGLQGKVLSVGSGRIAGVMLTAEGLTRYRDVTLTNAQVLALRATPISLVAAPGSTKMLEFISAIIVANGTAGAWLGTTNLLGVKYANGAGLQVSEDIVTVGLFAAAIKATRTMAKKDTVGMLKNSPLVIHNIGAAEFTGGAAANSLRVRVFYRIHGFADFGAFT